VSSIFSCMMRLVWPSLDPEVALLTSITAINFLVHRLSTKRATAMARSSTGSVVEISKAMDTPKLPITA
jgi:hypothetical protein